MRNGLACPNTEWRLRRSGLFAGLWPLFLSAWGIHAAPPPLNPAVEIEEDVYSFVQADNGAGPLWCGGSTCLVRAGTNLFASGLETLKDCPPLNNCRWTLFRRTADGWQLERVDETGRTREPSPLAGFPDGRLFLSANPTLVTNRAPGGGPAQPQVIEFSSHEESLPSRTLLPAWLGHPRFTEHSYRSFAADSANHELILFQNIDYNHAEWTFFDRDNRWSAQGRLVWPWGAEYDKPQRIRICYPNVALKDRAVHFCGVSDIVEPYQEWRAFKKELTGREWDYDFRRLFYTWTPDIRTGTFKPWLEIASRDKTAGWISPCDLWAAPDGSVHILWTERAIDERLREKFFPEAQQSHALNYAVVREGTVVSRRSLVESLDGREIPSAGRFQITPENRLVVFYYVSGRDAAGNRVSENRLMEVRPDGEATKPVRIALKAPFTGTFTATIRAGSPASRNLELLGHQAGKPTTISYARIRLW